MKTPLFDLGNAAGSFRQNYFDPELVFILFLFIFFCQAQISALLKQIIGVVVHNHIGIGISVLKFSHFIYFVFI